MCKRPSSLLPARASTSALLSHSATLRHLPAAARHVLDVLRPLSTEEGGPLLVQHVSFVEGRGNIIVEVSVQCTLSYPHRGVPRGEGRRGCIHPNAYCLPMCLPMKTLLFRCPPKLRSMCRFCVHEYPYICL